MGYWKERAIQEDGQGWSFVDDAFACDECISDAALAQWVRDNANGATCSYCGRSAGTPVAVGVNDLFRFINASLATEYDNAIEWYPYEAGEMIGSWEDSYDLADNLEMFENEVLRDTFINSFSDRMFCPRDPYGLTESAAFDAGWRRFIAYVKHQSRFYFLGDDATQPQQHWSYDGLSVSEVPSYIGEAVSELDVIVVLPADAALHRVRIHEPHEHPQTASELGSVPAKDAKHANRMSPAGISMFYGASDRPTALLEAYEAAGDPDADHLATTAVFRPSRPLRLVDFANRVPLPSLFDESTRHLREKTRLINGFRADVAIPIERDGREHIEYVPSQVVAEYFRRRFPSESGMPIDGIAYPSTKGEGTNYVLFIDNDGCVDTPSASPDLYLILDVREVTTLGPGLAETMADLPRAKPGVIARW